MKKRQNYAVVFPLFIIIVIFQKIYDIIILFQFFDNAKKSMDAKKSNSRSIQVVWMEE
jgi:hypothetical protein